MTSLFNRIQEGAPTMGLHSLFICLIIIVSISCGPQKTDSSIQIIDNPTPINLEDTLEQVGISMSDLQSFKFFLYHRNGDGSPLDGLILTEATGLIEKPGNISVTERIYDQFKKVGYTILEPKEMKKAVLDSSNFGVPQKRKRVIIIGIKKSNYNDDIINKIYDELVSIKEHKKTVKDTIFNYPSIYSYRR